MYLLKYSNMQNHMHLFLSHLFWLGKCLTALLPALISVKEDLAAAASPPDQHGCFHEGVAFVGSLCGRKRPPEMGGTLQVNKATMNMLRYVEPYITWGFPNLKSVRELIYKRGYGKVTGKIGENNRIALTDNTVIEKV